MGVFARLLRRSKATEEASTAETQAENETAELAADEAAEAKEPTEVEAAAGNEAETKITETGDAEDPDGSTVTAAVEDAAAEGVEIPKQQSAAKAADREADEGART